MTVKIFEGKSSKFVRMLDAAFSITSKDETRPHLTCVVVAKVRGRLSLVATDGKALTFNFLAEAPEGKAYEAFEAIAQVTPGDWKFIKAIAKTALDLTASIEKRELVLETGDRRFAPPKLRTTRVQLEQDEQIPPYMRLMHEMVRTHSAQGAPAPTFLDAGLLQRVMKSADDHAAAIRGYQGTPTSMTVLRNSAIDPVYVIGEHTVACVMPVREGDGFVTWAKQTFAPEPKPAPVEAAQ